MKKLIVGFITLFIILFLPIVSLHAQESTETSAASASPTIDYKLPYPGILPDNPLYKLKVLRDKIMIALIRDPNKKAEYYLLLANKQFGMSKQLVDKSNIMLAKDTALKAENQITLMTFVYKGASLKPQEIFLNEVKHATLKHQELLKEIIAKVPAEDAVTFSTVLEFSQRNIDELQSLTLDTTE